MSTRVHGEHHSTSPIDNSQLCQARVQRAAFGTVEIQDLAILASNFQHPLKVTFFGTDNFSLRSLSVLKQELDNGNLIGKLQVVTSKLKKGKSPVEGYSVAVGLPLQHWPVSAQDLSATDIGVVVSFGHLIPAGVINAFSLGVLNVHGSLLPAYRGAAPIIHAVLNGDTCTGITVMRIHPYRFDVGEILSCGSVEVGQHTKSGELYDTLSVLGAQHLLQVLKDLPHHYSNAKPQPSEGVSYARKVSEKHAVISWENSTAEEIYRQYLALDDHYPLTAVWEGVLVNLREAVLPSDAVSAGHPDRDFDDHCRKEIEPRDGQEHDIPRRTTKPPAPLCPGQLAGGKGKSVLWVGCARSSIIGFKSIKLKGKKAMNPHDFHNGFISKVSRNKWFFK
ncbi:Formyl transferase N-terminal [Trinorchestia longiramus]|nr:Formyl transferase N-terminal [Trinorchestia longiramus]